MKEINFIANRHWLKEDDFPKPISKSVPEWYQEYTKSIDGSPTWKACPAILDIMISGYTLNTPCDITFYEDNNEINVKVSDKKYDDFCVKRGIIDGFPVPAGYNSISFAWIGVWGIKTPKEYSSLFINPANRFDLPFINTVGIIDTDTVGLPGSLPFFVLDGWTGTIPKGTPYAQIIPFKKENWQSKYVIDSAATIYARIKENYKKFRTPSGGVYKKEFWRRSRYL
jgi:hypothetical protein